MSDGSITVRREACAKAFKALTGSTRTSGKTSSITGIWRTRQGTIKWPCNGRGILSCSKRDDMVSEKGPTSRLSEDGTEGNAIEGLMTEMSCEESIGWRGGAVTHERCI